MTVSYNRIDDFRIRVPRHGNMRTDALVYLNRHLEKQLQKEKSLAQVCNVACLPGIVGPSLAMPDIHPGYGFPIGGVAAFAVDGGVVSPGGVGYDINCGVRVLVSAMEAKALHPRMERLIQTIAENVPAGVGSRRADLKLSKKDMKQVLRAGAGWALDQGFATERDVQCIENNGCLPCETDILPSQRAMERGYNQLGTLGSGNHFIEVGCVDEIYDTQAARAMGFLRPDQVTVSIHSGSRGLGHQVCTDSLASMVQAVRKYAIPIPDRQLSCAYIQSAEGQAYLALMAQAANFAFVNRQLMTYWVRQSFADVFSAAGEERLSLVYDVCHNIAKIETHHIAGRDMEVCVHRKGATRAFGPGDRRVPGMYRSIGQPVLIPGDMGRYSYVLAGTRKAMAHTFGSTCHGAGRLMSRHQAVKQMKGHDIKAELRARGIIVRASGRRTLMEEFPGAYKDVSQVIETVHGAGISRPVVRLRPLGVVKG